jgi:translation initiation factor IF-3
VLFKGREMAYTEQGEELLNRFIEGIQNIAKVESSVKLEGRNMNIILVPAKPKSKKTK